MDVSFQVVGSKRNINKIKNVAPIDRATPYDLTFCSQYGNSGLDAISKTNAGVVLCNKTLGEKVSAKPWQLLVLVDNPRLMFMHVVNRIHGKNRDFKRRISPLSYI